MKIQQRFLALPLLIFGADSFSPPVLIRPQLSASCITTTQESASALFAATTPPTKQDNDCKNPRGKKNNVDLFKSLRKSFTATLVGSTIALSAFGSVMALFPQSSFAAEDSRVIGQLKGSGLLFKDTLEIEAFEDPKVRGVQLYISTFQIPITERFGKNLFNDPSYASVGCARTGAPVAIASNIARGPGGEEVFEEKKSLLFKELRVYRIFDEKANTVVYVSFNTRLDKSDDSNKSRFKSSLCAINLDDPPKVSAPLQATAEEAQ